MTIEKRPMKEGMRKDSVNPNVSGKIKNVVSTKGLTLLDVHPHVFDLKEDSDLVPMIMDNVGGNNEGEKLRDKETGHVAGGEQETRKVRGGLGKYRVR